MKDVTNFLDEHNLRTLLFTGINIDQCVMGTLHDASLKGFDTILLKPGSWLCHRQPVVRTVECGTQLPH
jgi:nicotinamidase-related amidase